MTHFKGILLPFIFIVTISFCSSNDENEIIKDKSKDTNLNNKRQTEHSFIRFGRGKETGYNSIYFGKKVRRDSNIADLVQYLQRSQEPSWKRGHSIMRFGKRSDRHNFIRFGKRNTADSVDDDIDSETTKRQGHSMIYFGKRNDKEKGHSMLYFGKRLLNNDEKFDKKNGHSMLYFGKRNPSKDAELDKKNEHAMLYFGKRWSDKNQNLEKKQEKQGHSMLYFGKRPSQENRDPDKKPSHTMMYFGKREEDYDKDSKDKIIDSSMYLSEQQSPVKNAEVYKTSPEEMHSVMIFSKLSPPEEIEKNSQLTFEKKLADDKDLLTKNGHSMMYFGKRNDYDYVKPSNYIEDSFRSQWRKISPLSLDSNYQYPSEDALNDEILEDKKYPTIHFGKHVNNVETTLPNFIENKENLSNHDNSI